MGVSYRDEDLIAYNPVTNQWSLLFDGSDVGLGNVDVDAFTFLPNGHLLLSVDKDFKLNGFGDVDESDILDFTPTSLGEMTSGSYMLYVDGSDVGLEKSNEDIDAIAFDASGNLLISVNGSFDAQGIKGADEDLFALTNATFGANTSGTWTLYFDGSDVGLTSSNEDISSVWADHANRQLYLTTYDNFSVTGASGDEDDIFICQYTALGNTTACTFTHYWDGDKAGFDEDAIDGLLIGNLPSVVMETGSGSGGSAMDDSVEYAGDDTDELNPLDGEEEESDANSALDNHSFLPIVAR